MQFRTPEKEDEEEACGQIEHGEACRQTELFRDVAYDAHGHAPADGGGETEKRGLVTCRGEEGHGKLLAGACVRHGRHVRRPLIREGAGRTEKAGISPA